PTSAIWYEKIFMLGRNQIHCDFYKFIKLFYQYSSYKLNDVANDLVGSNKVDVSAVEIRYLYWYMKEKQIIPKERVYYESENLKGFAPPFEKTMKYNTVDVTLLVDIQDKTKLLDSGESFAEKNLFGLLNMNALQQQYRTIHFCLAIALSN